MQLLIRLWLWYGLGVGGGVCVGVWVCGLGCQGGCVYVCLVWSGMPGCVCVCVCRGADGAPHQGRSGLPYLNLLVWHSSQTQVIWRASRSSPLC